MGIIFCIKKKKSTQVEKKCITLEIEKDFKTKEEKEFCNLKIENSKLSQYEKEFFKLEDEKNFQLTQENKKVSNLETGKNFQLTIFKEVIKKNFAKNVVISQASFFFPFTIISKGVKNKNSIKIFKSIK